MKTVLKTITACLLAAQATAIEDAAYHSAYTQLKDMLESKTEPSYEKAVFVTENAWYNNQLSYAAYQSAITTHTKLIEALAQQAREEHADTLQQLNLYQQRMFKLNTTNWAIYQYLTDTTLLVADSLMLLKTPYAYSTTDPYGTAQWEHTQTMNLLAGNEQGNCYALSSLFKILSNRLQSDAQLAVAPHHIYIQNRDARGDYRNVELATRSFPGDGTIQTYTYTPKQAILSGIAQRRLTEKQAIALCLVYLAKGYEQKHETNNHFSLQCAETALLHDSLNLNAMLLKLEVLEDKVVQKGKTINELKRDVDFVAYEQWAGKLHQLGYREMPADMQQIITSTLQGGNYKTYDKTPNPFEEIGVKQRYATLSGGLFEEAHRKREFETYGTAIYNTKQNRIIGFKEKQEQDFDPVVFALSVDPLKAKYPGDSPYLYAGNNPITLIDKNGLFKYPAGKEKQFEQQYPKLTNVLKNIETIAKDNPYIITAMIEASGADITKEEVISALKYGSGPTINIKSLGKAPDKFGTVGSFGETTLDGDQINLNKVLVNKLEGKKKTSATIGTLQFGVIVTIFHENTHALDINDKGKETDFPTDNAYLKERGYQFEHKAFPNPNSIGEEQGVGEHLLDIEKYTNRNPEKTKKILEPLEEK